MFNKFDCIARLFIMLVLAILTIAATCWGGPPAPPVIATAPLTPVGGTEIATATAVAMAGYGFWKSRK